MKDQLYYSQKRAKLAIFFVLFKSVSAELPAALQRAPAPPCSLESFNTTLNGTQCFGLTQVSGPTDYASCAQACCARYDCQMFEFCEAGCDATGCWVGSADLSTCKPGAGWSGAARPVPPKPARDPQNFRAPYTQSPTPPLDVLDLADEVQGSPTWVLAMDGYPQPFPGFITVCTPSGGYNSDRQQPPWLVDSLAPFFSAVYSRTVVVPADFGGDACSGAGAAAGGCVLRLAFGAVNHGASVYVAPSAAPANATLAGVHYGPNAAFDVDLTAARVERGGSYLVTVAAWPFQYFDGDVASGFRYPEAWQKPADGWASRQCAGICKYVRLVALPRLRVDALVVRGNFSAQSAAVEVVVSNDGADDVPAGAAALTGMTLSSWNQIARLGTHQGGWPYPPLATLPLPAIAAGSLAVAAFSIDWSALGPASWWWPNRPHNDSYFAQLHFLNLTLAVDGAPVSSASQRFGVVEHAEGASFFYTLNGVRVNFISDATPENGMSFYDAYSNEGAFGAGGGARETWRRYMRLGVNANRIHQSTPTQAMLDAADEVGFLLKPETAVRGCPGYEPCNVSSALLRQSVAELVEWSRAHPSVFAYSVENESGEGSLLGDLIDAATAARPGVPLTLEGAGEGVTPGTRLGGHAVGMLHYAVPSHSRAFPPRGVGECAWCVADGLEQFSALALAGRLDDVAYYSGWDMLNYWPNLLAGMNASLHAWHQEPCNGTDRRDGIDGWDSPVVAWVQAAFNPFLVADVAAVAANPGFTPEWPTSVDTYTFLAAGGSGNITRSVALFNDALADAFQPWAPAAAELTLQWSARWEDSSDPVIAGGTIAVTVAVGFHETVEVSMPVPDPGGGINAAGRQLFFSFASFRAGDPATTWYSEERVYVLVKRSPPARPARGVLGRDPLAPLVGAKLSRPAPPARANVDSFVFMDKGIVRF